MIDPACDRRDHRPATHEIREDLIGYDAAARERILELEAERDGLVAVLRFIVVNQTGVSPVAIARAYLRGGDAEQTSP